MATIPELTDKLIRACIKRGDASIACGDGLRLVRLPSGNYAWQYNYRNAAKKQKTISYGKYPLTTFAKACERHAEARDALYRGEDPMVLRAESRRVATQVLEASKNTFRKVAEQWLDHPSNDRWTDKYRSDVRKALERHVFGVLGDRPLSEIETPEAAAVVAALENAGKGETARRTQQRISQIFVFAISQGYCKTNPARELRGWRGRLSKKPMPCIPKNELPELLAAIDEYNGVNCGDVTRLAMRLMTLVFTRTGELIKARWSEFDFDEGLWVIPAERMKMREEHLVPLSRQSLAILADLKAQAGESEWVFPSPFNRRQHISGNTILFALYRMGFRKRMSGHGFRTLCSTLLNEMGWNRDWIEKQLAHEERNKSRGAYNTAEYIEGRAEMMQAWADYVDEVRAGKKVPLRSRLKRVA